jgi:NTE family protein
VAQQPPRLRRGLILGGGGTLGASWTIGALVALHNRLGLDARDADLIVGTSAGSILAALLGAGASADDLWRHQHGHPVESGPLAGRVFDYDNAAGGPAPPRPQAAIGSPRLIARSMRHPRRFPSTAVISAFLPAGRGSLGDIGKMVEDVIPSGAWSPHPGVRVVAMDYDSGERVVFGEPGSPHTGLAEAVVASCSIPGWYTPAVIGGRRYVDGGIRSATSLGVLRGTDVDEVYVLAPMASTEPDHPLRPDLRIERRLRQLITRALVRQARLLSAEGKHVTIMTPGPSDLAVMGANLMDGSRRRAVLEQSLRTSAGALARIGLQAEVA